MEIGVLWWMLAWILYFRLASFRRRGVSVAPGLVAAVEYFVGGTCLTIFLLYLLSLIYRSGSNGIVDYAIIIFLFGGPIVAYLIFNDFYKNKLPKNATPESVSSATKVLLWDIILFYSVMFIALLGGIYIMLGAFSGLS